MWRIAACAYEQAAMWRKHEDRIEDISNHFKLQDNLVKYIWFRLGEKLL